MQNNPTHRRTALAALAGALAGPLAASSQPAQLFLSSQSVKFVAQTNVAAEIHGSSHAARGLVRFVERGANIHLAEIAVRVPVSSLRTGIVVRDRHMQTVFRAADGSLPDVQLTATGACAFDVPCSLPAHLEFRGVRRPLKLDVTIRRSRPASYRASGRFTVSLSAFGVAPPCRVGLCVRDAVAVTFDVAAPAGSNSALPGGL